MDYAALAEYLADRRVRLGLKLTLDCPEPGTLTPEVRDARLKLTLDCPEPGTLTPEVRDALKRHKPLVVARVAEALRWEELQTWEWSGFDPGPPPF